MGLFGCTCPPDVITTIPKEECSFGWGEIQKAVLREVGATGAALATVATSLYWTDPTTGLINLTTNEKAQATPFLNEFTKTPGDVITEDDLNNSQSIRGVNVSTFSSEVRDTSGPLITALKTYICRKRYQVYFINSNNQIICKDVAGDGVGFEISNVFFADRSNAKNVSDKNLFTFDMKFGEEDSFVFVNPEPGFFPLEDL